MDRLRPHIQDIRCRTDYRKRQEAIEALRAVLEGYSARECLDLPEHFF